jgi:uncharacterized membrane protein (UPF0127 family)
MTRRHLLALLAAAPLVRPFGGRAEEGPTKAQPTLPTEKLVIVTRDGVHHDFQVELATTPDQQETGLMFRQSVPAAGGMLFDWGQVRPSQMWMRNTLVPLDMLFIGPHGTVRRIAEDTVPESLAIIDGGEARATLELAGGTAARLDIRVGDKVLAKQFGNLS